MTHLTDVYAIPIHIQNPSSVGILIPIEPHIPDRPYEPFLSPLEELKWHLSHGQHQRVLEQIAKLEKSEQGKPEILSLKIAAHIYNNELAAAKKDLYLLSRWDHLPDDLLVTIAKAYLDIQRPIDAMSICQIGLAENPRSPILFYQIGLAYGSLGNHEAAIAYYETATKLNQLKNQLDQYTLNRHIAYSYLQLKQFARSKDFLSANGRSKSLLDGIVLAKYFSSKRMYGQALGELQPFESTKDHQLVTLLKAQIHIISGKPGKASSLLESMEHIDHDVQEINTLLLTSSLTYLLTNKPDRALATINKVHGADTNDSQTTRLARAIIHMTLGNNKGAADELSQAPMPFPELTGLPSLKAHLSPSSLGPTLGLAYFLFDQGYYENAIDIVISGLTKNPNNIFLQLLLAESYRSLRKYDLAIAEFKKLVDLMPESYALKYRLAKTMADRGLSQKALLHYADILRKRPDYIIVALEYGNLLSSLGQLDRARGIYEMALNYKPDSISLLFSLGWSYCDLKDFAALKPVLATLKKSNKADPASILHLEGWAAFQQKKYEQAVRLLSNAFAVSPGDPELYYHLGMSYILSGEPQKARNLLEQAFLFPEQRMKYKKMTEEILRNL